MMCYYNVLFNVCVVEILQVVTNNRIWKLRTIDVGVVKSEDALDLGFR